MRKAIYIVFLLLVTISVYSLQVDATSEAIANASPGDYIIRENGEMIFLKQADIDYAKEQLGLNIIQENQTQITDRPTTTPISSSPSTFNPFLLIVLIIIGIIFFARQFIKKSIYSPTFFNRKAFYENDTNNKKTYIDQKGYRRFTDTDKPVHRYLAEKKIGRKLRPGEVVHHINRNKLDNSPDNLQIFSSQEEHDRVHKESGWY